MVSRSGPSQRHYHLGPPALERLKRSSSKHSSLTGLLTSYKTVPTPDVLFIRREPPLHSKVGRLGGSVT